MAAAALAIMAAPSHTPGRLRRGTIAAAIADPIASPAMKATSIALNAYVVGPSVMASTRVHVTSYTSATKPDTARTDAAIRRCAGCERCDSCGCEACDGCE